MSVEKQRHEARRWLDTAAEDLDVARTLLGHDKHAHACFAAQQCGEKAVKALWHWNDEDPWGHSVQRLLADLPDEGARARLGDLLEDAALLDRCYVPTRYPNGLPDLTPGQCFFRSDAECCIAAADRILNRVRAETKRVDPRCDDGPG